MTPETKDAKLGCQKQDAVAFCVLQKCNKDAVPEDGKFTLTTATHEIGFACDHHRRPKPGITNYKGPFFGIKDVKVDSDVLEHHGAGSQGVVRANCVIPGKYESVLRAI